MKIEDLPEVEEGDYGWCIYDGEDHEPPRLVFYDDDDFWCTHGRDKDPEHRCGDIAAAGEPNACYLDSGAIIHDGPNCDGMCVTVPYLCLKAIPTAIHASAVSTRSGAG